jgi:hypothetical protein
VHIRPAKAAPAAMRPVKDLTSAACTVLAHGPALASLHVVFASFTEFSQHTTARRLPTSATVSDVLAALPQWGVDADAVDFAHGCLLPAGGPSRCLVLNFTRCRLGMRVCVLKLCKASWCVVTSVPPCECVVLPGACPAALLSWRACGRARTGSHGRGCCPRVGAGPRHRVDQQRTRCLALRLLTSSTSRAALHWRWVNIQGLQ